MKKWVFALPAFVAGLLAFGGASAAPITYAFTGTTYGYAGTAGQTLTGTFTYDPALYTGSYGDGATINQRYVTGAPVGSSTASVVLSGGLRMDLGDAGSLLGVTYQSIVKKGFDDATFGLVNSFEMYAAATDAAGYLEAFELLTQAPSTSPDLVFAGAPANDLSVTQPVSFLTPGSWNVGYFAIISPDSTSVVASNFVITSIEVVPEPAPVATAMAGLAVLALAARRRRAVFAHPPVREPGRVREPGNAQEGPRHVPAA